MVGVVLTSMFLFSPYFLTFTNIENTGLYPSGIEWIYLCIYLAIFISHSNPYGLWQGIIQNTLWQDQGFLRLQNREAAVFSHE